MFNSGTTNTYCSTKICLLCGVYTPDIICGSCIEYHSRGHRRCARCNRHLPNDMFKNHSTECDACFHYCQHSTTNNVGGVSSSIISSSDQHMMCLDDRMTGDRTWYGTVDDINVCSFIQRQEKDITDILETARNVNEVIRYYFNMDVNFYRITGPGEAALVQRITNRFFTSQMISYLNELNLPDIISQFTEKIDYVTGDNSGWILFQINHVRLIWSHYHRPPLIGTFIETPKWIASKNAITNIQCCDNNASFQYSVLAGMNLITKNHRFHKHRLTQYKPYMNMLNMNGIDEPVPVSSIGKFENQNPEISVNVLQALNDKQDIVSIYISKFGNQRKYHVNLLLLTYGDMFHYTSIQSLSRLIRTNRKHRQHVCQFCLYPFSTDYLLKEHLHVCNGYDRYQRSLFDPVNTSIFAKRIISRSRKRRRTTTTAAAAATTTTTTRRQEMQVDDGSAAGCSKIYPTS